MSLSPAPLSLLIKAAPILTEDMYGDIQPAAWELLPSVDEHMAAAAGECTNLHSCLHHKDLHTENVLQKIESAFISMLILYAYISMLIVSLARDAINDI